MRISSVKRLWSRERKVIALIILTSILLCVLIFGVNSRTHAHNEVEVPSDSSFDITDVITTEALAYPLSSAWTKGKPISISGSTHNLTDYQVKMTVSYDSDMQSDFDDLRFTDTNGNALDYWIENYAASSSATVWVEVHSIPASGTTIYMYYGNPNAVSASSGDRTFVFFDDFESGNLSKWDVINPGGAISPTAFEGTYGYFTGTGHPAGYVQKNIINESIALTTHMKWQSGGSFWTFLNARYCGINHYDPDYRVLINAGSNPHIYTGVKDTVWHRFDILAETEDSTTFYFDNSLLGTINQASARTYIRLTHGWQNINGAYFDLVYLRRYVSSEPTAIIGNESFLIDWPMFRHDPYHSGCSISTAPNTNNTSWIYPTGLPLLESSPAVADGMVFIGTNLDHQIHALNATTGLHIWNYTTGHAVFSSPAVAEGMAIVGCDDYKVYALNATTGLHIWNYTTGDRVRSSPAVADDKVFVGSLDTNLYCLNLTNGDLIWMNSTGSALSLESSPAVADGRVYIGSDNQTVICFNATTGAKIWTYQIGDYVRSSPSVVNDIVYVGSMDHNVYALNATTGLHIWNYTTGDHVDSSPAVAYGKVYIGSWDHNVYALNATTGGLIWNHTTGGEVYSSPAVADGKVYIGSWDHNVYALNATTGTVVWNYNTGNTETTSPAVARGKVFVSSWGTGNVYAFGPNHDVLVKDITTSKAGCTPMETIGQGYSVNVNVTVANEGDVEETFNTTLYANFSIISKQQISLNSGDNITLMFSWNTAGYDKGNYTLSAAVDVVEGEIETADNTMIDGTVLITVAGDVDGDKDVDIYDIVRMSGVYGVGKPDPRYDPNSDWDGDGDIDIYDIVIAADNYGKDW